jgi:hypothetical protein
MVVIYNNKYTKLLYANGITFYKETIEILKLKTCNDVYETLKTSGYIEGEDLLSRCNPEVLDYVMVITEYPEGLLIFCSDMEDSD